MEMRKIYENACVEEKLVAGYNVWDIISYEPRRDTLQFSYYAIYFHYTC